MGSIGSFHEEDQYSWVQILAIWLSISLPMLLVYTTVPKNVADLFGVVYPFGVFFVIIGGLMWQFVVGFIILRIELEEFTWNAIKERTKLYKPRAPSSNNPRYVWLWMGFLGAFINLGLSELAYPLEEITYSIFPDNLIINRDDLFGAIEPGMWWVLLIFIWGALFNYFLGEELIFRGILLPKLKGVAGRFDWVLGGFLFGFYHLHLMVSYPTILATSFMGMYLSKRYSSNWIGVIVHGIEGLLVITLVSLGVLGLISV